MLLRAFSCPARSVSCPTSSSDRKKIGRRCKCIDGGPWLLSMHTLATAGVRQPSVTAATPLASKAQMNFFVSVYYTTQSLGSGLAGADASLDVPTANQAIGSPISSVGGSNPWRRLREAPSQQQDHANWLGSVCASNLREDADQQLQEQAPDRGTVRYGRCC